MKAKAPKEIGKLFCKQLLKWNAKDNRREMPWKGEKNPYKIWLSEVILQQTRVEQGLKYYKAFVTAFPTVHHLAKAPEQKVFKLWEGLGYYSRCKNLIASANYISNELGGVFPTTFEAIMGLKGVGSYTASAIASFAYNLPYAVLDGNVFRVLSRIYNNDTPIDLKEGKAVFSSLAQQTLAKRDAGNYNQAIMDFGAQICKPVPLCSICFFNAICLAYRQGRQQSLPIKEKVQKIRIRWFNYIIFRFKDAFLIRERIDKDIWQHLYEFPLIETENEASIEELQVSIKKQWGINLAHHTLLPKKAVVTQKLSHQTIHFSFYVVQLKRQLAPEGFISVLQNKLSGYPFPKTLKQFIEDELDSR